MGEKPWGKFLVSASLPYISLLFYNNPRFGLAPSPQPLHHIEVPVTPRTRDIFWAAAT